MARQLSTKEKFPTFVDGVKYNIYVSYPDTITEVFLYKIEDITMFTATVNYVDPTKEQILSVEWT